MFLHAMDLSRLGHKKLSIVTPDSDVIIIAFYAFWKLDVEELWVQFGVGTDTRWIPIHAYASILGEPVCFALPFWHAFSGCDTVSQFAGKGKKTAWTAWVLSPESTRVFGTLPYCEVPSNDDMRVIEQFVDLMYEKTCPVFTVNECRRYLFTKMNRAIENCPPKYDSLFGHTKRAMLQSLIWLDCVYNTQRPLDITRYS